MARSRFFPLDDLTHGEWLYLEARYRDAEEFRERRDRFREVIKRLVRKGRNAEQLHRAWMAGINVWVKHRVQQTTKREADRHSGAVARACKDLYRALASLRALVPPGLPALDDDTLLELRELLLTPSATPPTSGGPGSPWAWKRVTEDRLKAAGVVAADRREFLAAIGFLPDE